MKPQRNAPCPCGSGKKWKRCCNLRKHETHVARAIAEANQHAIVENVERRRLDRNPRSKAALLSLLALASRP